MHLCAQELLALVAAVPAVGWAWRMLVVWYRSRGLRG